MPTFDLQFLARKERAVAEDLKTAFSGYERLIRQIIEIRRWMVMVQVAAIGVLLSGKLARPAAAWVPGVISLGAFFILELRERSSMRFNKKEVLDVEEIFMISDAELYGSRIASYTFRDLRLAKLDRPTKLVHLAAAAFDLNVAVWYGAWAVILWSVYYFS